MAELAPNKSTADWLQLLEELDVPHVQVSRLEDLRHDEQLQAVGMFQRIEHPEAGAYTAVRSPFKFSETPASIHRLPPALGEHTEELRAELDALDRARSARSLE